MNRVLKLLTSVVQISLFTIVFSNTIFAEIITIRSDKNDFSATYKKDNKWEGMDIDVIREMLLRAKLDYRIVDRPFKRSLVQMQKGKIHLIPNLVKNKERSAYMDWLGPTRITSIGMVVLKKDQHLPIKTSDDLIKVALQKKKKFGYLIGASYSTYFDNRLKNDLALKKVLYFLPDNDQHRQMLKVGRIMGYFADAFEIRQRILDKKFAHQYEGLVLHSYRIEESFTGAYIGISKKLNKTNYQKIMTAFQSMKDDGTFDKIHLNWVGAKPSF